MNSAELRVLASLLRRLDMSTADIHKFLNSRGVTDEQLAAAQIELEVSA